MGREKIIQELNILVVINNDRIDGYETASESTDEIELITVFSKFAQTSQKCRYELIREIEKLGGNAEESTNVSGKFFRAWMNVKSALSGKDRNAILNSCKQGEDKAIETYKSVFNDKSKYLTADQLSMIKSQYGLIVTDLGKIRSMQKYSLTEAS